MTRLATDTIVLIHGLWMTPLAWEHWVKRYEQRGFKVITPGYPGVEQGLAGVEALRQDLSPLADLGVREVFDYLADVISKLETKPIIIGHSFGGTFVQLLLDAGFGTAGVSVDGVAVKGILALPFSEIRATFPVLHMRNLKSFTIVTPFLCQHESYFKVGSRISHRTHPPHITLPTMIVRHCCSLVEATTIFFRLPTA
jgi:pimeloyl-ACP methyl ester carboxylesterase